MQRSTAIASAVMFSLALGAGPSLAGGDKKNDEQKQPASASGAQGNGEGTPKDDKQSGMDTPATERSAGAMGNGAERTGQRAATKDKQTQKQPPTSVTTSKVMQKPSKFFGKRVTITAPVGSLHGEQVLSLESERAGGAELLVLLPRESSRPIGVDEKVTVTGTLRQFVDADIYIDHDLFSADEAVMTYVSAPVLVARDITTGDGIALLAPKSADERMASATDVKPGEIAKTPAEYFGKTVRIDMAEVERVEGPHVFLLDEDKMFAGPDVVVINPRPARSPEADAEVRVIGKVRPFVEAELRREYDWFDLEPSLALTLRGRPVVIADSVQTEAGAELVTKPAMGQ